LDPRADALVFVRVCASVRDALPALPARIRLDARVDIDEFAPGRETNAKRAVARLEAHAVRELARASADSRYRGVLDGAPVGDDARVRRAPLVDDRPELMLGETHFERAHYDERVGTSAETTRQCCDFALRSEVLRDLLDRDAEHLRGRRLVDALASAEDVEHPLLASEPRDDARLDRGEARRAAVVSRRRRARRPHALREHDGALGAGRPHERAGP